MRSNVAHKQHLPDQLEQLTKNAQSENNSKKDEEKTK